MVNSGLRSRPAALGAAVLILGLIAPASAGPNKPATPHPDADVVAVLEAQFAGWAELARTQQAPATSVYASGAMLSMTGASVSPQAGKLTVKDSKWVLFGTATLGAHTLRDVRVGRATDGTAAWVSFLANVKVDDLDGKATLELRASELLVRTADGWKVAAAAWSRALPARALAKAAAAGTLAALEPPLGEGVRDSVGAPDVIAALDAVLDHGLDPAALTRASLTAIGPTTGELAKGGAAVGAFVTRTLGARRDGPAWAVTNPAGTAGCATANVQLPRGAATVPARVFLVVEKAAGGAWSVVHLHVAAAPPAPRP